MLHRVATGEFVQNTKMTIGVDFRVVPVKIKDGKADLLIWDFGGEERFRFVLPSYLLGTHAVLLLYDLARDHTFYELQEWVDLVHEHAPGVPVMLCGAKADLLGDAREWDLLPESIVEPYAARARKFVDENGLEGHVFLSSKTGLNVERTFREVAEKLAASCTEKVNP